MYIQIFSTIYLPENLSVLKIVFLLLYKGKTYSSLKIHLKPYESAWP